MSLTTLAILPLLLTLTLLLLFITKATDLMDHSKTLCASSLLKTQEQNAKDLNQLLTINKLVKTNYKHIRMLKYIKKIPFIYSKITAAMALKIVQAKAKAFRLQQQNIINKNRFVNFSHSQKLKNRLKKIHPVISSINSPFKALKINSKYLGEGSYLYNPVKNIKHQQSITTSWVIKLNSILPRWSQNYLSNLQSIKMSCSASIQKNKEALWTSTLVKGSPLSSFVSL